MAHRIGLLGFGCVGGGVWDILNHEADRIAELCGDRVEVARIGVRDLGRPRTAPRELFTDDCLSICTDPSLAAVIEVTGGVDPTWSWLEAAIRSGKPVVTANKELLAKRWGELMALGGKVRYEAAVCAGVPVIQTLREALATDSVESILGVMNGTTNYILTRMEREGLGFDEILADAQRLGYAEADPTSDVDGWDAAYKLRILSRLAGDRHAGDWQCQGIRTIQLEDLEAARALGYRIKLLAQWPPARVEPTLIPLDHPLAALEGTENGVSLGAKYAGRLTITGRGAGANPTAAGVVADLICLLRGEHRDLPQRSGTVGASGPTQDFWFLRTEPGLWPQAETFVRESGVTIVRTLQDVGAGILSGGGRSQLERCPGAKQVLAVRNEKHD